MNNLYGLGGNGFSMSKSAVGRNLKAQSKKASQQAYYWGIGAGVVLLSAWLWWRKKG